MLIKYFINMMDFITAGKITKEAVILARKNIREGVNIYDYVKKIEDFIKSKGAGLAFPVNISINEYAAHDTADYKSNKIFQAGQVVKVDIGAEVNGYVGDSAFTSEIKTKEYSDLILSSEKALSEALKIIKPGIKLREIGAVINSTIAMFGYNPIKNLGGHGVGKYSLHTGIFIPNYDNHDNHELKEDDMVAIEPFATTGKGSVVSSK